MLVTSLEFKFDERRRAAAAVEDVPKMFCGEFARSVADFGVEFVFGTEQCSALRATEDRTVCLVFGNEDALIFAMRTPKLEFEVHKNSPSLNGQEPYVTPCGSSTI
jgi:hypothetical protein